MLHMSSLFVRTLREDPAEAEVPSHKLLVRAGYVRRVAPGGYVWLPLGKLVLDQVSRVVREEMLTLGAQEVSFPALLPREPYDASGRWDEYGPEMFRLHDRRGADHLLAPTHEEMFALLVRDILASYRDYPLILFQFQTKYRDEQRPRAGLLRAREFLMKDSYSFDLSQDGLLTAYAAHRGAYQRIFDRLGLRYAVVSAVSGPMGGSVSEEFLAETPVGEDTFAACPACGYAANTEAVTTPVPAAGVRDVYPPLTVLDTPDTPTIESLVAVVREQRAGGRDDWSAADTLKNVALSVGGELLIIGLPGDREVDLKRVAAAVYPATVALFDDFASRPDLVRGFIGPQGLCPPGDAGGSTGAAPPSQCPAADRPKARYLVDPRVAAGTSWITGANQAGRHAINVVCGRDFVPDGTIEAAVVEPGDPCPRCGSGLAIRRGVEVGHIFQLGQRYADVFGLDALGPDGKQIQVTMGSYGIGISRLVATIAEQHHDEHGLCWPAAVAPAQVHLVALGAPDAALRLATDLQARGLRVLVDDRAGVSAGVKFADAELIGASVIVVLGRRLVEGYVELRDRAAGTRSEVELPTVADRLVEALG